MSFQSPLYAGALFFRGEKTIAGIPIDAFINENHRRASTVTRNPVEEGADVTDNIHNDPDVLSIEGVIGAPLSIIDISRGSPQYILDVYSAFKKIREQKIPVTVVTGIEVYTDMAIEEFEVPRSANNGQSFKFNMSFVKLNIVESQTVVIPTTKLGGNTGTKRQASGKQKAGQTTGTETTGTERASFLEQIRKDLGVSGTGTA